MTLPCHTICKFYGLNPSAPNLNTCLLFHLDIFYVFHVNLENHRWLVVTLSCTFSNFLKRLPHIPIHLYFLYKLIFLSSLSLFLSGYAIVNPTKPYHMFYPGQQWLQIYLLSLNISLSFSLSPSNSQLFDYKEILELHPSANYHILTIIVVNIKSIVIN